MDRLTNVVWNKLDETEQDLIVAMFNVQTFSVGGRDHGQDSSLWTEVKVNHPDVDGQPDGGESEHSLWDSSADIVVVNGERRLKISGSNGPHGGHGPKSSRERFLVLPADQVLTIGARVGN